MGNNELILLLVLVVIVLPASLIYGAARLLGASKRKAWGLILAIAAAAVLYVLWMIMTS